ncbi:MAG: response regulator transcription factor [Actinomycetota bacterium]
MICDDHPATARGLAGLLEVEAPDVKVVGIALSGKEAEEMARELSPDVVVMDIYMPGVSGIEATHRVRASSPGTKVMILSVSDLEADIVDALRAGATGYVTKDRDLPDIVAAIRATHSGQLTVPAGVASEFLRQVDEGNPSGLSDEGRRILLLLGEGKTNRQIGEEIHVSERTVRRRIRDIYATLKISDPRGAAAYAARVGSLYVSQAAVWSESARRRLEARLKKAGGTS